MSPLRLELKKEQNPFYVNKGVGVWIHHSYNIIFGYFVLFCIAELIKLLPSLKNKSMKSSTFLKFLFFIVLLVLCSCDPEEIVTDPTNDPITEIPTVFITGSLNGTVMNEAGAALENVTVYVAGNTTKTDAYGIFSFSNIEMNKNGALVTVEKEGYFDNSKLVHTSANETSISKIMLIEKKVSSTFAATAGGTTTLDGGAKVVIPSESIQLDGGGNYTGNVNVYATWIDPTADDLSLIMPGDLRGTNDDDEAVKLVTYGMIGVELEGDNGEALNIAEGQTATIEIPVPSSLLGSAPATIPLWHFDESSGYWVEEGEATLSSNNTYIGTVSHFSFWNVDVPYELVHIGGQVTDMQQAAIAGLEIQISLNSNGETAYGYTDYDGMYEGYVPKDEELVMKIYDDCGEEIYNEELGSFSADARISDITISNSSSNFLTVSGILTDCNDELEDYGYVFVELNGFDAKPIITNADGSFEGTIGVCDQMEVTISGISLDPFSQGTSTLHDITGLTELNVGTLKTCW